MLRVDKSVVWDNIEYTGYQIYSVEWILGKDEFYVVVIYLNKIRKYNKIVKHKFNVGNDVDVDTMIKEIHNLHK